MSEKPKPTRKRKMSNRATVESVAPAAMSSSDNESASRNDSALPAPNEDEIARRAYQLYVRRGGGDGQDLEDWLQAEQELRATNGNSS